MDFLNEGPYSPNGFLDPIAQRMLGIAAHNISIPGRVYERVDPITGYRGEQPYLSDESYGGLSYQYVKQDPMHLAVKHHHIHKVGKIMPGLESGFHENAPTQLQLVHSIYQSVNELWHNVRNTETMWGDEE